MNKEYRATAKQLRYDADSRTLEGYAVVFDSQSVQLADGCTETISRSAITPELIANSDVFALIDHSQNKPLARSKNGAGSLQLDIDEIGLHFRFSCPHNEIGNEAIELVERGDIDACSFCFSFDDGDSTARTYTRNADGTPHRNITAINGLYDVSIVHFPAYPATSVTARNAIFDTMQSVDAELDATLNEINTL